MLAQILLLSALLNKDKEAIAENNDLNQWKMKKVMLHLEWARSLIVSLLIQMILHWPLTF